MDKMIIEHGAILRYDGDCQKVTKLCIPANSESFSPEFEKQLFHQMTNLKEVTVEKGNRSFAARNGILYDRGARALIYYPRKKNRRKYKMPNSVSRIWRCAFTDGKHWPVTLEEVVLSNKLTEIPDNCFRGMNVFMVEIPEGITRIGRNAFAGSDIVCPTMPASLHHLAPSAFQNCPRLHLFNIREDNFGLTKEMLPKNDSVYVILESTDRIDRIKYPGISMMNLTDMENWIETIIV